MDIRLKSTQIPLLIAAIAWSQEIIDQVFFQGTWNLPMGPGFPLWGVFSAPFSHSGFAHLFDNTLVFLPASWLVLSKGIRDYIVIWSFVIAFEIPVLIFSRSAIHGLSGVIYGLMGYLLLIGILERRPFAIMLSCICILIFGGSLFALIPAFSPAGVSWLGHSSGFSAGLLASWILYHED